MNNLPRRAVLVINGGWIGTIPEVTTYVEKLLPAGVGNQEPENDEDNDNQIEYSKGGIPILKHPMYPGKCQDCE